LLHLIGIIARKIVPIAITPVCMDSKNAESCGSTEELTENLRLKRWIIPCGVQLLCRDIITVRLIKSVSELPNILLKERIPSRIFRVE
jgi:hypothetical protein